MFSLISLGFIFGGTVGALLFNAILFHALLLPGVLCVLIALCYRYYVKTHPDIE
ncbi:hypothetical protein JCM19232_3531 [Vibrio ishigakensis]|uniref:Uncharacterized protein n=1 Tax=Vibrio ishigakensis TaxID=1481914 RepID=A0A0B8PCG7_9VIBR|nr:hypothetical protein JCM19232_3531 [Vibrio ishigakensis]